MAFQLINRLDSYTAYLEPRIENHFQSFLPGKNQFNNTGEDSIQSQILCLYYCMRL